MKNFQFYNYNPLLPKDHYNYTRCCIAYPINTSLVLCKNVEFKAGDKLYISKYSSIPSMLFNKLKFDLIQVRKPELADYVIVDTPKDWIMRSYSGKHIWENEEKEIFCRSIKTSKINHLHYCEQYNCVDSKCLLKYLDERKDKPTEDVITSICQSLSRYDESDNKLAVDLLKYYDFSKNKIDLVLALMNIGSGRGINALCSKHKYLKYILDISHIYNYRTELISLLNNLMPIKNMTKEEISKAKNWLLNQRITTLSHYIKQEDYHQSKHYLCSTNYDKYLGLYQVYDKK